MWLGTEDSIFLFHKTLTDNIDSIRQKGLELSTPMNPTEQILEYYRQKYFPKKPSRANSIFFVSTLNTMFKSDIGIFGEKIIILGINFNPELMRELKLKFIFYEYNHSLLMSIWQQIQPRIRDWHEYDDPPVWEQEVILTKSEIEILLNEEEEWRFATKTPAYLDLFWKSVKLWDKQYKDNRALYCHQAVPPELITYMIDVLPLPRKGPWPYKLLQKQYQT